MPIQTRCPACAAAVPTNAAWCSLCHADLRPRHTPAARSETVVPGSRRAGARTVGRQSPAETVTATPPEPSAPVTSTPGTDVVTPAQTLDLDDLDDLDDVPARGRHSRGADPAPPPPPAPSGRHAAGRRARSGTATMDLESMRIPAGGDVSDEEVVLIADQMISRLAMTEPRPKVLDPSDLPGGKWGFAAASTVGVVLVLLVLYTLLGVVVGH